MAKSSLMRDFVEMVQECGYHVLFLKEGGSVYHVLFELDGTIRAIIRTDDRRVFWTVRVPEAEVLAGNVAAVKRLIESRMPVEEETW
jgi:hypothetical protein